MTPSPHYDPASCDRCGLCVTACPCHAASLTADGVTFACDHCCHHSSECPTLLHCLWPCEEACPRGAIHCRFDILLPEDDGGEPPATPPQE
ncbi:MAG TPA: 4Fe-4S binding protein [Chloroflexi bacterium]|jgi:uncharacterized Fe-S center protein|nr:4Fe-4S binding protein [Chloroflexota bacterium]